MRLAPLLLLCAVLTACDSSHSRTDGEAVVAELERFVSEREPAILDRLFTGDYALEAGGQTLTREQALGFASGGFATFSDLQAKFRIVDETDDALIAIEVTSGTHDGEAFLGVPAAGHRVTNTVLHILHLRDQQISRAWVVADFGNALAQAAGQLPSRALDDVLRDIDAAAAARPACTEPTNAAGVFEQFRRVMEARDASDDTLNRILSPEFRLTAGNLASGDRDDVRALFGVASAIGSGHDNSGFQIQYQSDNFIGAYGPIAFQYENPDGLFNLPALAGPAPVKLYEVQLIGACGDQVFRQFSHANVPGMLQQLLSQ